MTADRSGEPHAAPTIYDVAELAGVAPSTVSRTFARPGRVSFATAEKVRAAAAQLGYRSTSASRTGLDGSRRTMMISLVLADISNPVFFELIRGAEAAASQAGYMILLHHSKESDRTEREGIERTLPIVDGVLLTSSRMSDSAIRMAAKQKPTVVINRAVNGVACVVPDNARGMRRVAEHLGASGRRHIVYVAGPEASWSDGMRWRALRETSLELDLRVHRMGPFEPTAHGGRLAARRWLDHRVSAVVTYNDLMAMGFLRELREHGVDVPRDVSVVGFDNVHELDLINPPLTSVASPMYAIGATAVTNLIALIRGAEHTASRPVVLPSELVVRASSLPPAP